MFLGSGKSTIAKSLDGANIIETDAIRKELLGSEEDNSNNGLVFEKFYERIDESLKEGKLTVADSTGINRKTRFDLYRIAAKHKRPVRLLVMNIPKEVVKERNASRQRVVPEEIIDKMYNKLIDEYDAINQEVTGLNGLEGFDIQAVDIAAIDIVKTIEGDER